jgi:hypothetical protein
MSNFSDSEKKSMSAEGYRQSTSDSNKWINGSSSVKRDGDSTIINNGRHNVYGSGQSDTFFRDRIKK